MPTCLRYLVFALIVSVTAAVAAPGPALSETIGLVKQVENNVFGTPPRRQREKKVIRFPVVQNELLETEKGAGMLVEFLDKTTLTLGSGAHLVVDTFVYDAAENSVTSVFNLSVGILRYVSGNVHNANMQINTPTAAIGIRGSDGLIVVAEDGATSVAVFSGTFTVGERGEGGEQAEVTAAQSVSVSAAGQLGAVGPGPPEPTGGMSVGGTASKSGSGGGGSGGRNEGGEGGDGEKKNQKHGLEDDDGHHHDDDDDDFDPRSFGDDDQGKDWDDGDDDHDDDHPDDDHPDDGDDDHGGDGGGDH